MKTICWPRFIFTRGAEMPLNVQLWISIDGGKTFAYTGNGKFFRDWEDSREYVESNRSPLREFPFVSADIQSAFESTDADASSIPNICGHCGRACYQMGKQEGANRALCYGCKLAEYARKTEMLDYARS